MLKRLCLIFDIRNNINNKKVGDTVWYTPTFSFDLDKFYSVY